MFGINITLCSDYNSITITTQTNIPSKHLYYCFKPPNPSHTNKIRVKI